MNHQHTYDEHGLCFDCDAKRPLLKLNSCFPLTEKEEHLIALIRTRDHWKEQKNDLQSDLNQALIMGEVGIWTESL